MANNPKMDIDEKLILKLASLMDETGLTEIEYGVEGTNIRVSKKPSYAVTTPATTPTDLVPIAAAPVEANAASHPGVVKSPMVGVAYTSSDPDTPSFIKIGDNVSEGQTLLLIEAMKVFNPILAPKAGRVTQILITSGAPIEFGEPLVIIE
jgi:acetyl-CoA carboxylase biotin carboxyl carrier protein